MRTFAFAFAAVAALAATTPASAQSRIQVGTLVCSYGTTVGMIVGSRQNLDCTFHRSNGDMEGYTGTMTRVGIDLGVIGAGRMAWTVFTKTATGAQPRALAGRYVGATADASFGFGAGGNILVGGSRQAITLQPVSLNLQAGANIGVGIGSLRLR